MTSGEGYKDKVPLEAQEDHTEKVSDNFHFLLVLFMLVLEHYYY